MKFSEEHVMIRDTVRHRLRDEKTLEIRKDIREMKRKYEFHGAPFPWEWVQAMADLGLTGINIPEEFGGQGADNLSGVIAMTEMARTWPGGSLVLAVGNSLVGYPLSKFGDDNQKNVWLPKLAQGKILGSFGLTEPGHGSDAGSINETFAERVGGGWQVSGQKQFITNVPVASFIILFARTNKKETGHKGITAFLPTLVKNISSLTVPPPDHKLGNHAAHMGKIYFDNYFLFESSLFGEYENGFKIAMSTLSHGRNWIAAQGIGIMEYALELALRQTEDRKTFGKTLSSHSEIYDVITRLAVAIDVSKILLFYSAKLEDEGKDFYHYASLAKLFSSESARRLVQEVQQIYGGSGYVMESDITGLVADSTVLDIYEGASNVQIDVILDAWLKNKLALPSLMGNMDLEVHKKLLTKRMNGNKFLKLDNQRYPAEVARILPLAAAHDLLSNEFSKDWPSQLMTFKSRPDVLKSLIFDSMRTIWPKPSHRRSDLLWDEARAILKKN